MPPKSSLFMLLITCFFMHASNSRHLDLTNYKDFHRSKLSHKKTREENKLSVGVNFVSNPRGSTIDHSCRISNPSGVISLSKEDQYWALSKKGNQGANNSGNQDGKASLHKALQNATKSEGSRWPRLKVRENDLNSSILSEEDLIVTDYQPPRRKSPIHN